LLVAFGVSLFEAVTHVLTSVSTGGFSTYTTSLATYTPLIQIGFIILMIFGATSFLSHKRLLTGKLRKVISNREIITFFSIAILFAFILSFHFSSLVITSPIKNAFFQTFSAITTTGYSTLEISTLDPFSKLTLTTLMIMGGGAGSTAGGIKMIRVLILLAAIPWLIQRTLLSRRAVIPFKVGKKVLGERDILMVALYFFLYVLLLFSGVFIFIFLGYPFIDSVFEVSSAIGTVGLSTGITSPTLPVIGKIVLIIEMLLGRLEIFPVLAIFGVFSRKLREYT
jgi:trk system potassium uptake protein TrkH